ncbi:unnamed protein product [Rhizoctonia solani]|uniref:Uncharacterized protein n=1 Tax=Rhizoctonia solani TaxID=456999 RepID=A0A8H3D0U3_9AGAM|nr:unnamed protein product [Rhizoctonia solani]CAE6507361.1 unnamed protein product [Rhizoctonia solani]
MEICITLLGFCASPLPHPLNVYLGLDPTSERNFDFGDNISRPLVNAVFCLTVLCSLSGMDSDENLSRRVSDQCVLFASVGDIFGDGSRTRAIHDGDTQQLREIPQDLLKVSLHRRALFELVPASSSTRANHLVSIPHSELPLILTQKADASSPLTISVPPHPQLPVIPLAGAGSQVPFLLCMSEPLQPASELSFFLPLPYGLPFLSMGPIVIVALGAGAFVTTAAAGAILLRRKFLGKPVETDVEKGLEENIMERRQTGPGWKEHVEVDEKGPYELLLPLVGALSPRETDVTDADASRTPLSPISRAPAIHQYPGLSTHNVRQQFDPVPTLEGDISDTHAPVFPPGLPVPAKSVAVATPIPTRLGPISELNSLDTGMVITSWPVLAPTPVEELRTKANGQGGLAESDIKHDVVPQDEPSASSLEPCELKVAPDDSSAPTVSIHESDKADPFVDPADSVPSPRSEASLDEEGSCPPSAVITLDDPGPILESSGIGWPDANDSVSASPIPCADPDVTIPVLPASASLPELLPMSPKVVSSLLAHTLPLDTVTTTAVVFGEELSSSVDVSDPKPPRPFVPAPIIITSCLEDANEAPHSPFSDTSSLSYSSDSESSGPDTPTEPNHNLPFGPVLELSSKPTPGLQLSVCLPLEDTVIDEDMEIVDDFVIVGYQALDPPSPSIIYPELKTPKLPGGFEDIIAESNASSEQKPAATGAVVDVPPLTADMVQLCHAMLAVSNCAGLVAQTVVGFSVWWSLTLVPA